MEVDSRWIWGLEMENSLSPSQGGCRSILRAELGDLWSEAIHPSWTAPSRDAAQRDHNQRHLWFMAHDPCLLLGVLVLPLLGGGGGEEEHAPWNSAPQSPFCGEKGRCLGKGPALCPCPAAGRPWLLAALHGWLGGCPWWLSSGALGRGLPRCQCGAASPRSLPPSPIL